MRDGQGRKFLKNILPIRREEINVGDIKLEMFIFLDG
jgi:hypothetical protein